MKDFAAYKTNLSGNKWKIGWKNGGAELCSQTIEVVGEADAVEQALNANLASLRERNSFLFRADTEEMMEGINVQ